MNCKLHVTEGNNTDITMWVKNHGVGIARDKLLNMQHKFETEYPDKKSAIRSSKTTIQFTRVMPPPTGQ